MFDINYKLKKNVRSYYKKVENMQNTIRRRIREWEKAGIIPRIYKGRVVQDEQKK